MTGRAGGMAAFVAVWAGQFVSLVGSGLTSFGLAVWVYQRTGSATQFALISFLFLFPQVPVTMLGGVLADRYSRRLVMLASNAGAGLVSAVLLGALAAGSLQVWLVFLTTLLFGTCSALLVPSFQASVALLVPRRHLARANGMVQLAAGGSRLLAPLTAAALLGVIGLPGLVLIDLASFLVAIGSLAVVSIPSPETAAIGSGPLGVVQDVRFGLRYITARPGLLGLLGFFSVLNLAAGPVAALQAPLVLRFASPVDLGLVSSVGGVAFLTGGLLMSTWGGPRPRIHGVLPMGAVLGASMMLLGLRASVPLIAVATFAFAFCQPVVNAANATIWQLKVPLGLQGRVLSTLRMSAWALGPLGMLASGPLADRVFEPLLLAGGALAATVGQVTGVGPGRGIGLLLIGAGVLPVVAAIAGYAVPAVREVERRLPDEVAA